MSVPQPKTPDLFDDALAPVPAPPLAESHEPRPSSASGSSYSAKDIEVLEGLEPVRRRPGMYVGGTDERAVHHLFAEVLDNAMDEAVAGHARLIEVVFAADGSLSVKDDGRGIPVDPHPKDRTKSALEVIMTTLHSGGKFSGKAYETSGGLHGVGVSVVNALSERLEATVWKDGHEWKQTYARGRPLTKLEQVGPSKKLGTAIRFTPDPAIFGEGVTSSRRGSTGWPGPRPICSAASRSAGPARPNAAATRPRRRSSASPMVSPTIWPTGSRTWRR